ncbi:acetyl-CoA acetyltransferase [Rhodococcus sp. DMU1]|uniref:thiolase C-terminal domain-containing protein n=1 Tax=Rhodococcus sp. DMU1 TaxID=2722825 RepID=UPI0032B80C22
MADAGLSLKDIDGIATHHVNDCVAMADIAALLGLKNVRWFHDEFGGGGKAPAIVAQAGLACASGAARNIVVYRALNGRSGVRMGGSGGDRTIQSEELQYQRPYGMIAPAQNYALAAQQHMSRFGTTPTQLGTIAVQQRENAVLNPRALMQDPITIDDYFNSRIITEPFRLFDCCLETDGACAVVITTSEHARSLRQPPVNIRGWAWAIGANDFSNTLGDLTQSPARIVAESLWPTAGLGPTDVDVAQLYDAFTYSVLVQLEDYGFCAKGDAGPMVESGATRRDGSLPVNTHGGFLSEGYIHGLNHICEAVAQLRGQAGERQIDGAAVALSTGGPGYINGISSAIVLEKQ